MANEYFNSAADGANGGRYANLNAMWALSGGSTGFLGSEQANANKLSCVDGITRVGGVSAAFKSILTDSLTSRVANSISGGGSMLMKAWDAAADQKRYGNEAKSIEVQRYADNRQADKNIWQEPDSSESTASYGGGMKRREAAAKRSTADNKRPLQTVFGNGGHNDSVKTDVEAGKKAASYVAGGGSENAASEAASSVKTAGASPVAVTADNTAEAGENLYGTVESVGGGPVSAGDVVGMVVEDNNVDIAGSTGLVPDDAKGNTADSLDIGVRDHIGTSSRNRTLRGSVRNAQVSDVAEANEDMGDKKLVSFSELVKMIADVSGEDVRVSVYKNGERPDEDLDDATSLFDGGSAIISEDNASGNGVELSYDAKGPNNTANDVTSVKENEDASGQPISGEAEAAAYAMNNIANGAAAVAAAQDDAGNGAEASASQTAVAATSGTAPNSSGLSDGGGNGGLDGGSAGGAYGGSATDGAAYPGGAQAAGILGAAAGSVGSNSEAYVGSAASNSNILKHTTAGLIADMNEIMSRDAKLILDGKKQEFLMSLQPETLGKVTLRITTENGAIAARFIVDNEAALKSLESGLGQLKEALNAQGLSVQECMVEVRQGSKRSDGSGLWKNGERGAGRGGRKAAATGIDASLNAGKLAFLRDRYYDNLSSVHFTA